MDETHLDLRPAKILYPIPAGSNQPLRESPNIMIVRAGVAIDVLEGWAAAYQVKHSYKARCGVVVPKAQIGAIRGGNPNTLSSTPQICSIYVGAFIVPGQDPLAVKAEVEGVLRAAGVLPSEIEIYCFRRGYEAPASERSRRRAPSAP